MNLARDWGTLAQIMVVIKDYNCGKRCGLRLANAFSVDAYLQQQLSVEAWLVWRARRPAERAVMRQVGIAWSKLWEEFIVFVQGTGKLSPFHPLTPLCSLVPNGKRRGRMK